MPVYEPHYCVISRGFQLCPDGIWRSIAKAIEVFRTDSLHEAVTFTRRQRLECAVWVSSRQQSVLYKPAGGETLINRWQPEPPEEDTSELDDFHL